MLQIVHTLNRGVDKRKIFLDEQDHFRFIHDLFEFNDAHWVNSSFYAFQKSNDIASRKIVKRKKYERKLLVDILSFCLMPNHYHLLLHPLIENGISIFMKKLNMGYAKYFNQKYERRGALFEGRYKSVPVESDAHCIHLPYYIHLNPLDLIAPEWRRRNLKDYNKAVGYLESYRWSSHLDYLGRKNFPSLLKKDFLLDFFDGENGYKTAIYSWLKDLDLESVSSLTLEE